MKFVTQNRIKHLVCNTIQLETAPDYIRIDKINFNYDIGEKYGVDVIGQFGWYDVDGRVSTYYDFTITLYDTDLAKSNVARGVVVQCARTLLM